MSTGKILPVPILIILLSLSILSCSIMPSRLPRKMPPDVSISYDRYGGMVNEGESMVLKRGTCIYTKHRGKYKKRFSFNLDKRDMEKLYSAFRKNSFDWIALKKRMYYDRDGTTIAIRFNGKSFRKSDNASFGIRPASIKQWYAVNSALEAIKTREIKKQSLAFKIIIKGMPLQKNFTIALDDRVLVRHDKKNTASPAAVITAQDLPGVYTMLVCVDGCSTQVSRKITIAKNTVIKVSFRKDGTSISIEHKKVD